MKFARTLEKWSALLVFLLALLASTAVAGGRWGLGVDGAILLSVAQNIADGVAIAPSIVYAGEAFATDPPQLTPELSKPPLFAALVALLLKLGLEPKTAGWVLTQGSFAAAAVLFLRLAMHSLPLGAALAVTCLFVFQMSALIWSVYIKEDILFVAFSLAALLVLAKLRDRTAEAPGWQWLGLGALCAAAVLTRYLGVALIGAVLLVLALDALRDRRGLRPVYWYFAGLTAIGFLPFIRFVLLWSAGGRPAFFVAPDTTYYLTLAGILQSFQRDYVGVLFAWLLDGSKLDYAVVAAAVAAISGLLGWAFRVPDLRPLSLFVGLYLVTLIVQIGKLGLPYYEPRYSLPVEGLLLLIASVLIARLLPRLSRPGSVSLLLASAVAVVIYGAGQARRFMEFRQFPDGVANSREYCTAPETFEWLRANVPAKSTVMATDRFYQVIAETNAYYWLPIPPATLYAVDSGYYNERWNEPDILRIGQESRATWLVLLTCHDGDPLAVDPGYGPFVSRLFEGHGTAAVKLRARFGDGLVYEIAAQ